MSPYALAAPDMEKRKRALFLLVSSTISVYIIALFSVPFHTIVYHLSKSKLFPPDAVAEIRASALQYHDIRNGQASACKANWTVWTVKYGIEPFQCLDWVYTRDISGINPVVISEVDTAMCVGVFVAHKAISVISL